MLSRTFLGTLTVMLMLAEATSADAEDAMSAYDFSFKTIDGASLPMTEFKGKAVLVVNTASECGYTPQYKDLEALWQHYRDRGLVVLGVPSNDFGGQEPGTEAEIKRFCERQYAVDFPLTAKEQVSGANAHPFYKWAAQVAGEAAAPRWNFHKYLVGPDGQLAAWFPTKTSPASPEVAGEIEKVLP
jgi:glutathione peroxidase